MNKLAASAHAITIDNLIEQPYLDITSVRKLLELRGLGHRVGNDDFNQLRYFHCIRWEDISDEAQKLLGEAFNRLMHLEEGQLWNSDTVIECDGFELPPMDVW